MNTGAVAVLDALGFKGIWKRFTPQAVLDRLTQWTKRAKILQSRHSTSPSWYMVEGATAAPGLHHAAISDTVVFACLAVSSSKADWQVALNRVVFATSALISEAAMRGNRNDPNPSQHQPRFSFRGAIAVGTLAVDVPYFVGPAIDEAASEYEIADAGLVHLTGQAGALLARDHLIRNVVHPFALPLKNGEVIDRICVRPLKYRRRAKYKHEPILMNQILGTFDSQREDVLRKRDNTRRFLEELVNEEPLPVE